jgi:hypothetical protein
MAVHKHKRKKMLQEEGNSEMRERKVNKSIETNESGRGAEVKKAIRKIHIQMIQLGKEAVPQIFVMETLLQCVTARHPEHITYRDECFELPQGHVMMKEKIYLFF